MVRISALAFLPLIPCLLSLAPATAQDAKTTPVDPIAVSSNDWPAWRGANGNGIADPNQSPPLQWSKTENVVWQAPIPGHGHSSPTVIGDLVVITTADTEAQLQTVLAFDRQTGKLRWRTDVHKGNLDTKGHDKTSQASATVASDGERLFINFLNNGGIHATALDFEGKQLWRTKISDYQTHQGFGASPMLYGPHVFFTSDHRGGGVLAALDRATGKVVWEAKRPEKPNYASAVVVHAAGRDQLVLQGCDLVSSFDPLTGEKLWEVEGATTECVTTVVTDGDRVFTSGGFPRKHIQAVAADGSGKTAWESNTQIYVPSMIVKDGHLFALNDGGIATCFESATGKELWKGRLKGTFTSSLVLVGDHLFATNETGSTFIFKATPDRFELIGENQLGDNRIFATPAICGGRIYMRITEGTGEDQRDLLYCLGE